MPSARAVARRGPITLDGQLDEAAWAASAPITEFTQFDPDEGRPASERTEVRFLFDEEALYVGARMFDALGARGVTTRLVRRDSDFESDYFQVVIDGFHDHLGRAFFEVNPSGSKYDALGVGASDPDASWDGVWEVGTRIDSLGWVAEMRIPFSQLRFSRDSVQRWGLQVRRVIHRRNEQAQWAFWRKNEFGGPNRFGHLEGVRISGTPRHLELLPYAVTRSKHVRPSTTGDPFNDGSVQNARVGLDLNYSVTSNLQLSATLNPDFGQVEVDPAVVNLSQYETFFQEKRPFFVEGSGVFGFGTLWCFFCSNVSSIESFYSRRIGRAPTGTDLAYDRSSFVDAPDNSTILGAAKLTGRTRNGFTIGVMNAVTRREHASIDSSGVRLDQMVEPAANYFVGRIKRDMRNGNLVIGAIGTSVARSLDAEFAPRLTDHAELVGADVLYQFKDRKYRVMSQIAQSNVSGDVLAIRGIQTSAARYLQRPDRRSNRLDPDATSLQGTAGYLRIAKDAGDVQWEAQVNGRTAGYEVNDLAFLTRSDYYWFMGNLYRQWNKPTSWYRSMFTILGAQQQFNWDGDRTDRQLHYMIGGRTLNYWNLSSWILYRPQSLDDRQLRGGPVVARPAGGATQVAISSDFRKRVAGEIYPQYSWNEEGGWGWSLGSFLRYRAASNVMLSFGPSFSLSRAVQQYVDTALDATASSFYGVRYVQSGLDQKTLSLDTRVNLTFTPTMTLEVFAQPFIASGHFFDFKEFDAPRSARKSIYGRDRGSITPITNGVGRVSQYQIDPDGAGPAATFLIDNPDFNTRSLRGNVVFRWEYRPGSTLFVVWTQSREGEAPTGVGDFDFARDRQELFSVRPNNIFLVKVNYWLSR